MIWHLITEKDGKQLCSTKGFFVMTTKLDLATFQSEYPNEQVCARCAKKAQEVAA